MATAYNRIAGPPSEFGSSATAFLRDPQGIGGPAIAFSGLEPTDVLSLDPPAETPVEPAPCPPGSTGEAGTLQFGADRYTVGESNPTPAVRVTRTGGSTGAGHGHHHDQRRQRRGRDRLHAGAWLGAVRRR